MKVKPGEVTRHLRALDKNIGAVLIYGNDDGLVSERAQVIARQILGEDGDPMLRMSLEADAVARDASLIYDELAEAPLFGGRKLLRIRDGSDSIAEACGYVLQENLPGFLLVTAGALTAGSKLRKAFEAAKTALAIACYADDAQTLGDLIDATLAKANLQIERDAREVLLQCLGADRRLSRNELEKLTLYMASSNSRMVTLDDVQSSVADASALGIAAIADAALNGDGMALDRAYERALIAGESPIAVLRVLLARLTRLHQAAAMVANGERPMDAIAKLRPPVFWKERDSYIRQVNRWPARLIARALDLAVEAEIECKSTGIPAHAACGRALMRIAQAAQRH